MQTDRTPTFGDPEAQAWAIVLEAIENAIDVAGLKPFDRAELAQMYDRAQFLAGATSDARCVVPAEFLQPARSRESRPHPDWETACAPGGVGELRISCKAYTALVRGGVTLVEEVDQTDDETLLAIRGIGPMLLGQIRTAVDAHVLHANERMA